MAQPKPIAKNLRNDRDCGSKVDIRGHSADRFPQNTDTETLDFVGLSTPPFSKKGKTGNLFQSNNLRNPPEHATGNIFHLFPQSVPTTVPQYIRDIETLKSSKLKQAYRKEYESWRNRRDYAKKAGIAFYPPWQDFPVFLRELGTIPAEGFTLDKIEPAKGYVPGNVRWASKAEQTHNRPNTIWLTYNGKRKPLGVWATETGQAESTLRSRRKRGWPDESIITGHPPEKSKLPPPGHPWPVGHAQQWEAQFQRDTGGHADRFKFMAYLTAKRLRELSAEVDSVWHPDDYSPTPQEAEALKTFTATYTRWHGYWLHVQKEIIKKTGTTYRSPEADVLKAYR